MYSDLNEEERVEQLPLTIALSMTGRLYLCHDQENQEFVPAAIANKIESFFSASESIGLLRLGLVPFLTRLSASLAFWQQFSKIFIAEVCKNGLAGSSHILMPRDEIATLTHQAPFMLGVEYLTLEIAEIIWKSLHHALANELKSFDDNLEAYLGSFNSVWNTIGRVCFHLAENKNNSEYPFAFLATYTTGLSKTKSAQHLPLGRALEEYSGDNKKNQLLSLLLPVQKATEQSVFLKTLVDTGAIFKPLAWGAHDAHQFLKDLPLFEAAGADKHQIPLLRSKDEGIPINNIKGSFFINNQVPAMDICMA